MLPPHFLSVFVSSLLAAVLAIPSNTCIVIVFLEIIRKKEKLSPSDVIFLAKGILNILFQCAISLQGMLFVFAIKILYTGQVYAILNTSLNFLTFCSFWLSAWLAIYFFTTITNLRYGFFIWLKGMASDFQRQTLFLTALGIFIVIVPGIWTVHAESVSQSSENSSENPIITLHVHFKYFTLASILGCALPFFLSLLCFVLTFSFLLRHVWRVKNNDSRSTRPNLQAHVTALRTIFLLLCIFTFFCIFQMLKFKKMSPGFNDRMSIASWNLRTLSPFIEAVVIFQASNRLKRVIVRRLWTGSQRNTET